MRDESGGHVSRPTTTDEQAFMFYFMFTAFLIAHVCRLSEFRPHVGALLRNSFNAGSSAKMRTTCVFRVSLHTIGPFGAAAARWLGAVASKPRDHDCTCGSAGRPSD